MTTHQVIPSAQRGRNHHLWRELQQSTILQCVVTILITFNALAEETYSNCTIQVTDNLSNTSDNLSVSSFTIDKTAPTLDNVTIASNNSDNTTLAKTGNSNHLVHHLFRSYPNTQRKHCRSGCNSDWFGNFMECSLHYDEQ